MCCNRIHVFYNLRECPRSFGREDSSMAGKAKRKGGGRLNRSETVTVRLDPKLRYLAELAARKQRRTLSSFIEWAIEDSLQRVYVEEGRDLQSQTPYQLSLAQVAFEMWDVDEAERFVRLALRYPDLLTYEEQVLWKLMQENGALWEGTYNDHGCWSWKVALGTLVRWQLQASWHVFRLVAAGKANKSILPPWEEYDPSYDRSVKPKLPALPDEDNSEVLYVLKGVSHDQSLPETDAPRHA